MAMIEFENTVRIDRPVGEVFRFAADPENLPPWNYFVLDVKKTPDGEPGVGSTFHQLRKTDRQDLRIAAYEEGRRLALETVPPSEPHLVRDMSFVADGGGTRIVDRWQLELRGFQRLAARKVRQAVKENLEKLKVLLETGSVRLQDGRDVSL